MRQRLGDPEPCVPAGSALGERALLAMTPGEQGIGLYEVIGLHNGHGRLPQALAAPRLVEGHHGLLEARDRPTIVALHLVDLAKAHMRQGLQDDRTAGGGERQGTLRGDARLVIRAQTAVMVGYLVSDAPQPTGVVEALRQRLGLAQTRQDTLQRARRLECPTQGKPEVDGVRARVTLFR